LAIIKRFGLPITQVIIAALNEEQGVGPTISELLGVLGNSQVLVVDGKSTDRTAEIATSLGAEVIVQEGKGKGDALAKGIESMEPAVKYVVITDADYTYPAEYVPKMIKIMDKNPDVGMVCGNRFNGHVNPKALHNRFYVGNRLIAFSHKHLNGIDLNDPLTGLRVVRADILRNWKIKSKGFDIEVELNCHVEREGFEIAEIEIEYRERLGEKKLKLKDGSSILKRIIREVFSDFGF